MANYSWSGTWQSNTYYEVNTFVKYDNIAYVSTNGFQGSTTPPPLDMSNWNVFVIGYQQITPTPTPTIPETPTPTPSVTTTVTNTPSHTPVGSPTNTPSETETPTPTPTVTETPTPTVTETPTGTPSETTTPTPTVTETPTNTPTPTVTSTSSTASQFNLTLLEVGSDVVMSGSGKFDTTNLSFSFNGGFQGLVRASNSLFHAGAGATNVSSDVYSGITTYPSNFGSGGQFNANTGSGDSVGVLSFGPGDYRLLVPPGYISNTTLTAESTFTGKTFTTLGVTPGTYTYSWGTTNPSVITLQIGPPSVTPSSTPTMTETPTGTPSETTTPTPTPTNTETPTNTPTPEPTTTPTNTETPTNTPTPEPTTTPTNTTTPTVTPTGTPIVIPTSGLSLYVDAGRTSSYSGSGNQWNDLSGNNNTGTLQNSPTFSTSNGGILTFNGSNQYVSFSSPSNIPIGNSNYTISVWFNASSLGQNGFVGWGNYGSGNQVNALRLSATGFVHYWWANDLSVNTALSINTWYNVVARFDGTNRQLWLNNVLIGSDTPGSSHNVPNANNLTIGTTNVNEYFNGKISNVEIYNRAISDSEIAELYNDFIYRFT